MLKASGFDPQAASMSLMDRLLSNQSLEKSVVGMDDGLECVMNCTGFTADEAARTVLLREEIASLRKKGLDTVAILQKLTSRLQTPENRTRRHLKESMWNDDPLPAHGNKLKFTTWTECDPHGVQKQGTIKRTRFL